MTKTAALPTTQAKTLATITALTAGEPTGEVSEYAARTGEGYCHVTALSALVRKGLLTVVKRPFVLPVGPYAGQTVQESFYSVA